MNQTNSSLIGFLKKKSLFTTSPDRSARRKSKSKEKILVSNTFMTPRNQGYQEERSFKNYNSKSTKNLYKDSSAKNIHNYQAESDIGVQSVEQSSPIRYYNTNRQVKQEIKMVRRNFNFKNPQQPTQQHQYSPQQANRNFNFEKNSNLNANTNTTNVWTNLVNHANTFESARLQSKQCLDTLSVKLQSEISNINYKIDVFHSKMTKLLNNEFENLHKQILTIIDNVFSESEANIRAFIKEQEETLAGELIEMRQKLRVQHEKVQIMKEEINKPHWKKVAGELLSTELEDKIQQMVNKSKNMDIRHWEIGDLGANKVKALQYQLKEMVTLAT